MKTESEAIRRLIELGLKAAKAGALPAGAAVPAASRRMTSPQELVLRRLEEGVTEEGIQRERRDTVSRHGSHVKPEPGA